MDGMNNFVSSINRHIFFISIFEMRAFLIVPMLVVSEIIDIIILSHKVVTA